jgi:hypothetical protein
MLQSEHRACDRMLLVHADSVAAARPKLDEADVAKHGGMEDALQPCENSYDLTLYVRERRRVVRLKTKAWGSAGARGPRAPEK